MIKLNSQTIRKGVIALEIGEPKKTHTNVPKPEDIPEMEPEELPQPKEVPQPNKKESEVPA